MTQLDTKRNAVARKREELAKLNQDLAKEQAKQTPLRSKIISANATIKRTRSESTIKSRLKDIERAEKSIAAIEKKCAELQSKIGKTDKALASAEKAYQRAQADEDRKRLQESERQMQSVNSSLEEQSKMHAALREEVEQMKALPSTITVLFVGASPTDAGHLRLDEEARSIQKRIRLSDYRDSIRFESRWAVRPSDIFQAINETDPTVVHFSGHGAENGDLALMNPDGTTKLVSQKAMSQAMATASDKIRLVVFNACFSAVQAKGAAESIEASIGMKTSIGDDAACVFAAQLYSTLGFGYSVGKAFAQAKAALMLEGIPEESTPELFTRDGTDAFSLILVEPEGSNSDPKGL